MPDPRWDPEGILWRGTTGFYAGPGGALHMPRKSILVVDDEVSIRKALTRLLERDNYQVTAVKSSAEALSVAKDNAFNLVIADLILPDGNGLELIKKLQAQSPAIAAITITGNGTVESEIEDTKLGVFHYVTKPFN